jgi:hypothetical protein
MWIRSQNKECLVLIDRLQIKNPRTYSNGKGEHTLVANDDQVVGKYEDYEIAKKELDNVMAMLYADKNIYELN